MEEHFGAFLSSIVNIYWHRRGWGLASTPLPPIWKVQLEVETHPVTVGFSTVWQSSTTEVPRALTQAVYNGVRDPFPWAFGPV